MPVRVGRNIVGGKNGRGLVRLPGDTDEAGRRARVVKVAQGLTQPVWLTENESTVKNSKMWTKQNDEIQGCREAGVNAVRNAKRNFEKKNCQRKRQKTPNPLCVCERKNQEENSGSLKGKNGN